MNPAAYLVGRRVYRGASNAPTRGPVDPMGYINRALAGPVGGDGLSDRRTGLAQAALNRLRSSHGGVSGHQHAPVLGIGGNFSQSPVAGAPRNPIDFTSDPAVPSRGYTVSPTGQLLPEHPNSYDATLASMNGTPEAPNEAQLMQAARDRMMHHHTVMEAKTKHQINMQKLHMQAVENINRHRMAVSRG